MVTAARSKSISGPYNPAPQNPLLTNANTTSYCEHTSMQYQRLCEVLALICLQSKLLDTLTYSKMLAETGMIIFNKKTCELIRFLGGALRFQLVPARNTSRIPWLVIQL